MLLRVSAAIQSQQHRVLTDCPALMNSGSQPDKSKKSSGSSESLKSLGKYRIIRKIGSGGMGTVYLAEDSLLNRTVALKVLPKDRAKNPILVRRFQSEARASALLAHENIVSVFDADQADGYLYIALEYVDGIDVQEWLKKRETIPVKRSIEIIKQVTRALVHAHEKKLVHRDIKPANIMISRDGVAKLTDMGLARSIDETLDTTITRDGTTVGTVDYMAPEQARHSKNADITSDLYSLGCTWFHMLTGHPPYPEGDITNKLLAHAEGPLPDPRDSNPQVSESLVAILHRLMAKKKEDRYATPQELLDDLENAAHLDTDSGYLLATILDDDEDRDGPTAAGSNDELPLAAGSDDSLDFEVQEESQSKLLERKQMADVSETQHSLKRPKPPPPPKRRTSRDQQRDDESSDELTQSDAQQDTSAAKARVRKTPLKRVRSSAELHSQQAEPSPPVQQPPDTRSRKQRHSDEIEPADRDKHPEKAAQHSKKKKKAKATHLKKPVASKPRRTSPPPIQQPAVSEVPLSHDNLENRPGIQIEWGRVGPFLLIVFGILSLGWWVITSFGVDPFGPGEEMYEENLAPAPPQVNTVPPGNPLAERAAEEEPVKVEDETPLLTQDETLAKPRWVVAGWDQPLSREPVRFQIERGRQGRQVFHNLTAAFKNIPQRAAHFELTKLNEQILEPTSIELEDRLSITGTQLGTVLVFDARADQTHWLQVRGGTLEFSGLHFIIVGTPSPDFELLRLAGTDVILRDCTMTSLVETPVTLVGMHDMSRAGNRVYIENTLTRGPAVRTLRALTTAVDLYSQNSIFASATTPLFELSSDHSGAAHFQNSTLYGGAANLRIQTNAAARRRDNSAKPLQLNLDRSLLMGVESQTQAAIEVHDASANSSSEKQASVELKLRHTRIVNQPVLTEVITEGELSRRIADPDQWASYWGIVLPEEDVLTIPTTAIEGGAFEMLTAKSLETVLGDVARPGAGDRSQIGAFAPLVARLHPDAVQRHRKLDSFRKIIRELEAPPWTEAVVPFDLSDAQSLPQFLQSSQCPDGTTVVCSGAGIRRIPPIRLHNRRLRLRFEQAPGAPLQVEHEREHQGTALFVVDGGTLVLESGDFTIRSLGSSSEDGLFLETRNGGTFELHGTRVRQTYSGSSSASLIATGHVKPSDKLHGHLIRNSMISGPGTLLNLNCFQQVTRLSNSVLVSGSDAVSLNADEPSGLVHFDGCTVCASRAAIQVDQASAIPVFALETVFGPPVSRSSKSSAIVFSDASGDPRQLLDWWESGCAFSAQIDTAFAGQPFGVDGSLVGNWKSGWGVHRVQNSLFGPRAVVLAEESFETNQLEPQQFVLTGSCDAAGWSHTGGMIGYRPAAIGPAAQESATSPERPTPNRQPTVPGF